SALCRFPGRLWPFHICAVPHSRPSVVIPYLRCVACAICGICLRLSSRLINSSKVPQPVSIS
ncbi:hypothetical protein C8R44DRAFT_800237, partial [Mycena epipterygia]